MVVYRGYAFTIILTAVPLLAEPACAQVLGNTQVIETPEATVPERQSVLQRPRPDFDPIGLRVGSFLVFPGGDASESFDSNVFASTNQAKADAVTETHPDIRATSNWNNHALNFQAYGDFKTYAFNPDQSNNNFLVSTDGRLDIRRSEYIVGALAYQLQHEDRSSPNTVSNQKNPTAYEVATGKLGYARDRGIIGLRLDSEIDNYSYDNAFTSTGVTVPETGRNRTEYNVIPRVTYEIIPGYHAFVKTPVNYRQYMAHFDANGFDRTSHGFEVDLGTALDFTRLITGEVYAGYIRQDYDDSRLQPVSGVGFGANALWNITELTSFRVNAARTVEETTVAPASSILQSTASASVEHELLRNVLLTGSAGIVIQSFQGTNRTDDNYQLGAGVKYLISRNVSAGLEANYYKRDSNAPAIPYSREILTARVRLQF